MPDSSESESRRIKSVDQAFTIIDHIENSGGLTLSDLADELEMPISTAHIHLFTLVENGYLVKEDGTYECSFKFLQKGGRMRDNLPLFQVAKPELDDLQQETGEHTNLTVEEKGFFVQLYKSQGTETIDDDAPVGKYFHPHTTASGKAIIAQFPEERVAEICGEGALQTYTDNTLSDMSSLLDELQSIRKQGYSINRAEHYPGVAAVGATIESDDDAVLGAISVSGPLGRLSEDRIENELAPALLTKKNIIELKIRQRG